jgi:hypothetical protein
VALLKYSRISDRLENLDFLNFTFVAPPASRSRAIMTLASFSIDFDSRVLPCSFTWLNTTMQVWYFFASRFAWRET